MTHKVTYLLCTTSFKWHSQFVVAATITIEFTRTRAVVVGVTDTAKWLRKVNLHYHLARFA